MDSKASKASLTPRYTEIDIRDLFVVLWAGKITIFAVTAIFSIGSVFYSLSIPDQYKATTLLAPARSESSGIAGSLGQLGGLASLAGVNLGGGVSSETQMTKAIMVSRSFIEDFIDQNDLAVELAAVQGWNRESNDLQINSELYDVENQRWLGDKPSKWTLFKIFNGMLSVSESGNSGFLSVSIEYYSPYVAKHWLDLYVAAINEHMQERQIKKVASNISYLQQQIQSTSITDMQDVFYTLIEDQIKNRMLAEASPEYAFVSVSASMVPEEKSQPKRALICIFGAFLGGVLSVLWVFSRHYLKDRGRD